MKKAIIVEGGGFKTGFTSGILDAFMVGHYNPFSHYIGVSGGSVALSYYLSHQYRFCVEAMKILAKDKNFTNYKRTFGKEGYMDIDFLLKVAGVKVPFKVADAIENSKEKDVRFIATSKLSGEAKYLRPQQSNWLECVIASCTLPYVTKGQHTVDGELYFDGGWSDALPVKWAYENGCEHILVLRTWPKDTRSSQSWADYFGSKYFNDSPKLSQAIANSYAKYNESLDFIAHPPKGLKIEQITPKKLLKSGVYTYSNKTIMSDYRYGLDRGMMYLKNHKHD